MHSVRNAGRRGAGRASGLKPKVPASARTDDKRRQKAMTALIPILACALVFLLKNPLKVSPAAQSQQAMPSIAAGAVNLNPEIAWELPPLYPLGSRDPMRLPAPPAPTVEEPGAEPGAGPPEVQADLVVKGILYTEDRPAALVDTQLVREGQQVSGATVRKIERDAVVFEMDGRTWKQAVDK